MLFLFADFTLKILPARDCFQSLIPSTSLPLVVTLSSAGGDNVVLYAGAHVLLQLFVYPFECVAGHSPDG